MIAAGPMSYPLLGSCISRCRSSPRPSDCSSARPCKYFPSARERQKEGRRRTNHRALSRAGHRCRTDEDAVPPSQSSAGARKTPFWNRALAHRLRRRRRSQCPALYRDRERAGTPSPELQTPRTLPHLPCCRSLRFPRPRKELDPKSSLGDTATNTSPLGSTNGVFWACPNYRAIDIRLLPSRIRRAREHEGNASWWWCHHRRHHRILPVRCGV
mmetsp:Transcript_25424/g.54192  ORF Transcript_25424/g.54192 Transcript_25424/m.54192 type:complete len:214 (+) Transcript_25424:546-1187(+)